MRIVTITFALALKADRFVNPNSLARAGQY
jgi:hypothetical protein